MRYVHDELHPHHLQSVQRPLTADLFFDDDFDVQSPSTCQPFSNLQSYYSPQPSPLSGPHVNNIDRLAQCCVGMADHQPSTSRGQQQHQRGRRLTDSNNDCSAPMMSPENGLDKSIAASAADGLRTEVMTCCSDLMASPQTAVNRSLTTTNDQLLYPANPQWVNLVGSIDLQPLVVDEEATLTSRFVLCTNNTNLCLQ